MQWRKLARSKIISGRSRACNMLCCGRRKDNGRETLDFNASPLRAPPVSSSTVPNNRSNHPPPMVIQGDFRKVSGISSEIFKQIETIENDHDASTAAALEHVERRGEMIVRIVDPRQLGRTAAEATKRFLGMQDAKHTIQFVEIVKRPGQTLGLYIREGNGIDRNDGVFISRIALESAVYNSGCLKVGDEILAVNLVDVTRMSLDDVVIIMSIPRRLVLATRQRKGSKGQGSPSVQPRAEHKPPPVVVIKRDLREDEGDDTDLSHRDSMRQRHTGDGREMSESRSRLGLGLPSMDLSRHGSGAQDTNGLDLYYNSRPPDSSGGGGGGSGSSWGYQPPPPVITEQPKSSMQHFQPYERNYPNTLESLAEKVHSFGMPPRRMSAGGQPLPPRLSSQQNSSSASHYYVQHSGTGSRRIMPRSGSDQHLPHTEYSDYSSISQAGRHTFLRSSLKSGSTLSRYNQRYVDQAAVAAQIAQSKYGTSQYAGTATLSRRNRSSLDYSSDTEATSGPRGSYYYFNRNQSSTVPHSTIPTLGRQNIPPTDINTKFNSLPRDSRGSSRLAMNKRFGDRTVSSLLQDEADGALSAPEMQSSIRRDRDEYRQWLSRTPSTSAIYEQIRASRDVLNQQRAARFTYSAENIHDALKNIESGYYGSYGRPGATSTLDRNFSRSQQPSIPARSLSTQHITTSALGSTRSPSMRRMRQLLDLDSGRSAAAPSPVPTPSGTLPRGQRQLDINPAEFLKYKIDKPALSGGSTIPGLSGLTGTSSLMGVPSALDEPISGMLWVHLLAGRGLRASTGTSAATTPVTPSGSSPSITTGNTGLRDLYCVLECDRVHKARTVVRTGDLVFDWDESFELDLVNNRELDLLIYSWDPQYRHKLCYKGSVYLPTLLKNGPIHQLALKIEPRGTLYLRLRHTDSSTLYKRRSQSSMTMSRTTPLFGVDLETVVNRENKSIPGGVATGLVAVGQQIPVIVKRCVEEVERRGLDIIGLYRLCGSATKKRILREAFERNSRSVDLSPDNVPDINVITGVLKDYLRELPEPLFTKCLYQMLVDALGVCLPDDPEGNAKLMFSILDCLPRVNRATLIFLMDHLALVVSASDRNKMSAQNLATALAPPLMLQSSESMTPTAPQKITRPGELDYQQPISLLKYLLQIWPTPKHLSGRRGRLVGPRGDTRGAYQATQQHRPQQQQQASLQQLSEQSRPSAAPSLPPPRSAVSGQLRGQQQQVQSLQILGQSSASKGPYRPLSPRVGLPAVAAQQQPSVSPQPPALRPRQVIVSSPGSPSSSSDSQSGSDTVKHFLPSRVSSPAIRVTAASAQSSLRSSPSINLSSPSIRQSPSTASNLYTSAGGLHSPAGPRNSPSVTSLSRASPSIVAVSRSSSPAMQASSAGLNVTLGPSISSIGSGTNTYGAMTAYQSAIPTSTVYGSSSHVQQSTYAQPMTYAQSSIYAQPTTYASTNPFLSGAYLNYASSENNGTSYPEKYNTIGSVKDTKAFFESYTDSIKYPISTVKSSSTYEPTESPIYSTSKYNTVSGKYNNEKSYLSSTYTAASDFKYSPTSPRDSSSKSSSYDVSPNVAQANSSLLNVEDTPTPTSSIETEDSVTREVGEKDVEGDESVGCFELPHKRSPLQKIPEDPDTIDTKFLLMRRNINFTTPEIIRYDDDGESLKMSKFNFSQPVKMLIHGYLNKWNERGGLTTSKAYLDLYDCNMIAVDWSIGARGPQYTTAAANTEVVGRQTGILLNMIISKGMDPKNIHLIGFSLGAHVAGSASEFLKLRGYIIGRITGLDAASPLFRNNHLREKHKKLDREDAHFVDVIHTDSSPFATDGFGLWEPIGHVDFFPNGGQDQPGCTDTRSSVVVTSLDKTLTADIACSHIRAWQLFQESLLNKVAGNTCEFVSYSCPGGLPSFEKGHCFPHLDNPHSKLYLDPSYRSEIGKLGEDVKGEGVMYLTTKSTRSFCGTQLQASVQISQKTKPTKGILNLKLKYLNHTVTFTIKCEILDFIMTGTEMNGLGVTEFNTLTSDVENIDAILSYIDIEYGEQNNDVNHTLYIDRITIRDMYGNSWQFCGKDTMLNDNMKLEYDAINVTLSKNPC